MAHEFIFTTRNLERVHPPDKKVLDDISLSFFPGAKIGVIGPNGSGKSSLLRIMAGEDDGYKGEARLTPGFTAGFLAQEPELDDSKDVLGNVVEGAGEAKAVLDRYNAVCEAMADPDADFDALMQEQAELQDRIDALNAWDLDTTLEIAMDALRLPPGTPTWLCFRVGRSGASPSAGSSSRNRTSSCSTSPRTTSMPNRWHGSNGTCRSTQARSWP